MAPTITPAKVVEQDRDLQDCVKTSVAFRPIRVAETRRSYDHNGNHSDRTTYWNETQADVHTYNSYEWANFAICETADGRRCRFSTDDIKLSVGQPVFIVQHRALGVSAVDVSPTPEKKGWYTEVKVPATIRATPWIALAAALFDYRLHSSPPSAIWLGLATLVISHLSFSILTWLRTRLLIHSRKVAKRTILRLHAKAATA